MREVTATDSTDNSDKMPNLNGCTGELFQMFNGQIL